MALVIVIVASMFGACSTGYLVKAGMAEWRILRAREEITEVLRAPDLDPVVRGKLVLLLEARRFARDELGIDVGGVYSSYVELESDTLAMIVSAAYRDRLVPKTWWFPIVGRVPYRGHFSFEDAERERMELEAEGFDAMVRPTAAFSTLGWFDDPVLSTFLSQDNVEMVTTLIHELSHLHLYVPGRSDFNESYATFAGRVGAARFFCGREAGGDDTVWCLRAKARWEDVKLFGGFIDDLRLELNALYGDTRLSSAEKIERREVVFDAALADFDREVAPRLQSLTFLGFRNGVLNNVTLLSRIRYYHRLADFGALLEAHGGELPAVLDYLKAGVETVEDPWELMAGPWEPVERADSFGAKWLILQ